MYRDQDDTWMNVDTFVWLESGKRLLFTSERDGWRHAYAVARDGNSRLITNGAFDLMSIAGVDEPGRWLYYIASPDNATQRYLYRSRLNGSGRNERITPAAASGSHTYNLSPIAIGRSTASPVSIPPAYRTSSACRITRPCESPRTTPP